MDKETVLDTSPDLLRGGSNWSCSGFQKFQDLNLDASTEVPRVRLVQTKAKLCDREISKMLPRGHCFSLNQFYRLIDSDLARHSEGKQGVILNNKNAENKMGLHFYVDQGECSNVLLFVVFAEYIPERRMWFFDNYEYDDGVEWMAGSTFVVRIE